MSDLTYIKKTEIYVTYCKKCDHTFNEHFLTTTFDIWCGKCGKICNGR